MSVKGKIFTALAALSLAGGVSVAATPAVNAATSDCGISCIDFFSALYGTTANPGYILEAQGGGTGRIGQPIILAQASNGNPAEDFMLVGQGPVSDFYEAGLVAEGLASRYGGDLAYAIEYAPSGTATGECVGVGATPSDATPVTLQPCELTADTVWILDHGQTSGSDFTLINGATSDNFRDPYALTAGFTPGGQLSTVNLYTTVTGTALQSQQWGDITGAVASAPVSQSGLGVNH
jgi:hypothetical protein